MPKIPPTGCRFASLRPLAVVALLGAVLFSGQADAQTSSASSAEAVARQLRERYGAVRSFQADFAQTAGGRTLRGTIAVRGDAYRLDLGAQTLVTDGRTMWTYSRDDRQVVVQDYDAGQIGFSVGQLFTDYLRVFRATGASKARLGGVEHDVLSLRPRQAGSSVQDATLFVRSADGVPTRVRVRDRNGSSLAFDVSNVRLNRSLASSTFRFSPPRGTEVVDLR